MEKTRKHSICVLIAISFVLLFGWIFLFNPFYIGDFPYPSGLSDYDHYGYFQIDPETVLVKIDSGVMNPFSKETRNMEEIWTDPASHPIEIQWSQSEYFRIYESLGGVLWEGNYQSWDLYGFNFNTKCQAGLRGFDEGEVTYFRTTYRNGGLKYETRYIRVNPSYRSVAWGDEAIFPRFVIDWKGIKLEELVITADDALKIAEEHGGREYRESVDNDCSIFLILQPRSYSGWLVTYGLNGFVVLIDPYTGKIID